MITHAVDSFAFWVCNTGGASLRRMYSTVSCEFAVVGELLLTIYAFAQIFCDSTRNTIVSSLQNSSLSHVKPTLLRVFCSGN